MSDTSKEAVDLTPKPLLTISAHETTLYHMLYLPGGRRLVTSSRDCTVRTWNVENGEEEGMRMEHGYRVWGLAVTRDGKRILSSGRDELLRVWDAETHQPIAEWAHKADIICIASSPDDQLVASGDVEGRVVIREMKEGGRIKHSIETSAGDVLSICFSPDGTKLASGHEDNNIRVFDVENGNLILGPIEGHTDDVNSVVWSLDGKYLFTASSDQTIRSWDCESGETIGEPWIGHTDRVITISLSPDGTKLASASLDGTVRFWAPDSGDPIGEPLEHEWEANAVAFSPSGEFVACGGRSGKLSIWRVPWWDDSKGQAHKSLLDVCLSRVFLGCRSHSCSCVAPSRYGTTSYRH
ncbi:WD40 repeat-like protein [Paxillus ammoniavirescens]|nr:WD40 repeat-like protein [Paxillus ammoniavirescens]